MSPFSPTKITFNWTQIGESRQIIGGFRIHQMPAIPPVSRVPNLMPCHGVGDVYNPLKQAIGADAFVPSKKILINYIFTHFEIAFP